MAWRIRATTTSGQKLKVVNRRREEIEFSSLESVIDAVSGVYFFKPFLDSHPRRKKFNIKEVTIVSDGEPCELEREEWANDYGEVIDPDDPEWEDD